MYYLHMNQTIFFTDNQCTSLETIKKLEGPSTDKKKRINIDLKKNNVEQNSETFNIHMYNDHQNYNSRIEACFEKDSLENIADNKINKYNFEIEMLQNKELEGFNNRPSDTEKFNTEIGSIQPYSKTNDKNEVSGLQMYSSNDEIPNKYSFSNLDHKFEINWAQKPPDTLVDNSSKLLEVSPLETTISSTCYDYFNNSDSNSKYNTDNEEIVGHKYTETCDNKRNVTTNPLNLELEPSISSTIKSYKCLPKSPLSP